MLLRNSRACGTLRQSSQDRITLNAGLLEMLVIGQPSQLVLERHEGKDAWTQSVSMNWSELDLS